jgi:hypothetical protein
MERVEIEEMVVGWEVELQDYRWKWRWEEGIGKKLDKVMNYAIDMEMGVVLDGWV